MRSLLADYKIAMCDLAPYLPVDPRETAALQMDLQYLGYYVPWDPQEAYYYSVENVGFEANKVLSVLGYEYCRRVLPGSTTRSTCEYSSTRLLRRISECVMTQA